MRFRRIAAIAVLAVALPASAAAQKFGVMNSAETINAGNFKVRANPIVVFGEDGADSETGVAGVFGYGFSDNFDVEGKIAVFDGITLFGADAEFWAVKGEKVNVSFIGGFHIGSGENDFGTTSFGGTALASGQLTPKLELYGAFDLTRTSINDVDFSFTTMHLVPGVEFAVSPKADIVAEFGLALNDDSANYASVGLAFYFKPRR